MPCIAHAHQLAHVHCFLFTPETESSEHPRRRQRDGAQLDRADSGSSSHVNGYERLGFFHACVLPSSLPIDGLHNYVAD